MAIIQLTKPNVLQGLGDENLIGNPQGLTDREKNCWKLGEEVPQMWGTLLVYANNSAYTNFNTGFGKRIGAFTELQGTGMPKDQGSVQIDVNSRGPLRSNWVFQDPATSKIYLLYFSGVENTGSPNLQNVSYTDDKRRVTQVIELVPCNVAVQKEAVKRVTTGWNPNPLKCPKCPTNCKKQEQKTMYYARANKTSESDIPIVMNRKIIKCENTASMPQQACSQELAKLQNRN